MPELKSLSLIKCQRLEDLSPIALSKELSVLEIDNMNMCDADLEKISRNCCLKRVKLRNCSKITDRGIKILTKNCNLLREVCNSGKLQFDDPKISAT